MITFLQFSSVSSVVNQKHELSLRARKQKNMGMQLNIKACAPFSTHWYPIPRSTFTYAVCCSYDTQSCNMLFCGTVSSCDKITCDIGLRSGGSKLS